MASRDEERERREIREFLKVLKASEFEQVCIDYFFDAHARCRTISDLAERQEALLAQLPLPELRQRIIETFGETLRAHGRLGRAGSGHSGQPAQHGAMLGSGAGVMVDRSSQTKDLLALVNVAAHSVLLLPGALVEAHALFLARADRIMPTEPPVRVLFVHWPLRTTPGVPQFPTTKAELLRALAARLGGASEAELPRLLAQELMHHKLLFLHPRVERRFDDPALVSYYTTWLAEVLRPLRTRYHCVMVQPISWQPPPSLAERVWGHRKLRRQDAEAFMDRLQGAVSSDLPIHRTDDLQPITEAHIREFLRDVGYCKHLPDPERLRASDELVRAVIKGSLNSEQILHKLSIHLPGH